VWEPRRGDGDENGRRYSVLDGGQQRRGVGVWARCGVRGRGALALTSHVRGRMTRGAVREWVPDVGECGGA
jgi:hypothetical protein